MTETTKTHLTTEQREERRKWITALRSGKYEQTTNVLKKDGKFCCLGVYCDISGPGWNIDVDGYERYNGMLSSLPDDLKDATGLMDDDDESKLIHMNDVYGYTFSEIADYLEGTL